MVCIMIWVEIKAVR